MTPSATSAVGTGESVNSSDWRPTSRTVAAPLAGRSTARTSDSSRVVHASTVTEAISPTRSRSSPAGVAASRSFQATRSKRTAPSEAISARHGSARVPTAPAVTVRPTSPASSSSMCDQPPAVFSTARCTSAIARVGDWASVGMSISGLPGSPAGGTIPARASSACAAGVSPTACRMALPTAVVAAPTTALASVRSRLA